MPNGGGSLDPFDLSAERGLPPPWQWEAVQPWKIIDEDTGDPKAGAFHIFEAGDDQPIHVSMDYDTYVDWLDAIYEWYDYYDYTPFEEETTP